jgi:ADP-ribose pyrophosphatase YjhB (NUDIX family)
MRSGSRVKSRWNSGSSAFDFVNATDLTVAAVVFHDGRYLMVEETASGRIVFNQPGGHIEAGESPEQALLREVQEETGCTVHSDDLIGVYLWIHPQTRQQYLRLAYAARFLACDERQSLDTPIIARHWMTRAEIENRERSLRSPAVLRCIRDFEAGRRESDALLSGLLPLSRHVGRVMARADLV